MDKDPFSLRDLPARRAPEGLWTAIEHGLERPGPRRRTRPAVAAVAAAAVAAIALVAVLQLSPPPESEPGADGDLLASIRDASVQLEQAVAGGRSSVVGADAAAELAWIESELRLTDELLSERPRDVDLWLKRTELLGEMAQLYDRNDWRTQVRLASY
jgi:hypothetical protein